MPAAVFLRLGLSRFLLRREDSRGNARREEESSFRPTTWNAVDSLGLIITLLVCIFFRTWDAC